MTEPDSKAERRRPLAVRILWGVAKAILWLLGIVLGLLVLAWLAILIFFPDDKIRRMALEEIHARTGLTVTAGALDLEIFSGLVLTDVEVAPPPGFEGPPLAIDRVVVDYSLGDVLDDRIEVRTLRVERPRLSLRWRDGRSNLQALLEQVRQHRAAASAEPAEPDRQEPAGQPFQIALEQLTFSQARVEVDAPSGVRLELDGLAGRVSGLLAGPEQSRLTLGVQLAPGPQPAVRIAPAGLEARLGLDLNASLEGFDAIRAAVQIQLLDAHLAALGPAPVELRIAFDLALDLEPLRLRLAPLRVELDGRELLTAEAALPALHAGLAYELKIGRLDLAHPTLLRLLGPGLALDGRVGMTGAAISGDLGEPLDSELTVPLTFEGLGGEAGGVRLRGGKGRVGLKVQALAEGGQRASVSGNLVAESLGLGGLVVEQPRILLAAAARLDPGDGPFELQAPTVKIDGWLGRVHAGPLTAGGGAFSAELKARALEAPSQAAALTQPKLELHARADDLRAAGARVSEPRVRVDVSAANIRSRSGDLTVDAPDVRVAASAGRVLAQGLRALRPGLDLRVTGSQCSLGSGSDQPLRLRGRLTTGPLAPTPGGGSPVPAGSRIEAIAISLDTRLSGLAPARLPLSVNVDLDRPRVGRPNDRPAWAVDGPVHLSLDGDLRPATARLTLTRFEAQVADLLKLGATGWIDARTPAMRVDFNTSEHGLTDLIASLPEDVRAHVPALTGKVRLAGRFDGPLRIAHDHRRLPFSVDLTVDNIGVGLRVPQVGLALSGLSGPVRLSAGPAFDNQVRSTAKLKLDSAGLGGQALSASGVTVELASVLEGDQLKADGWLSAGELRLGDALPAPIARVRLDFASMLTGFKDLRLTDFSLVLGSVGVTSTGQGQILLTPGSGHIGQLRLSLQTRSRFESQPAVALPGGLSVQGGAGFSLGVRSVGPGVLRTEGQMTFEDFSLFGPGFAFEGASGSVPVLQFIQVQPTPGLLARGGGSRPAEPQQRSKAYEQALRPLKGQARSFSIRKLSFKDLVFTDMSGNLELTAGVLSLGSLRFGFLAGDVVADTTAVFAPADQRRLTLDAEMSGIDLSKLGALNLAGSSDVSGNLRLGLDWNQRDVTTAFNLTRIGRSTLQALLVALDPEEANPGLVAFRGFLDRYEVSPKEVNLDMRHGLLSLRTRLEMGPLARAAAGFVQGFSGDTFALTHIPVGSILSKYLDFGR